MSCKRSNLIKNWIECESLTFLWFPWDCLIQHPYLPLKSGQSLKALEEIKNTVASKYFHVSPGFAIYEAETSLSGMVIRNCFFLNFDNKDIILCWVSSHTGIGGNEEANSAAKSALELPHAKVGVSYTDFKHCVSQYILSTWQGDWNGAVANKLHSVKPVQERWNCLVSCPHRSYSSDAFIHLEKGSSTSVWAL